MRVDSVLPPAIGPGSRMKTSEHDSSIDPGPLSLADPLLDADEAARILGSIPAKTVLQLAREGRLPSVRIGRHVRFVRAELEATLAQRRTI